MKNARRIVMESIRANKFTEAKTSSKKAAKAKKVA